MSEPGSNVIASRHLVLEQGGKLEDIFVELGPLEDRNGATACHVRIAGEQSELVYDIYGLDAIQALQLALKFAGSELNRIADELSYSIAASKEPGHGFETIESTR